ncbi:DUF1330 domain-containing protein [Leptospira sarikeiensis]|uniref:DUF1330 domain-containing protein n=1 Tax=Leptospira sarikeiensis TaxID=2484943 RepID=A0A4R9K339_9LEPT|nr:DUF1330 domain-containing protein [Leptospira sarikeiensis]TGL60460.1 DUF1330 domain-containing protein [Leptospira sarikeiensis]
MKYYSVAELNITSVRWIPAYVRNVTKMVERYGGKYLARTSNMEKIEGEREKPQLFLIIEWPTKEALRNFYESEEYKPYLESRLKGSNGEFILVPGEDVNQLANVPE